MRVVAMLAVLLCVSAMSFGTVSLSGNTLTYGDPSDLGTIIDPPELNNVQQSFGVTKADFQALNPQVVTFNDAPGTPASANLRTLVVNYSPTDTVTFTFPAVMYNYGAPSSKNRGAFSGTLLQHAIGTQYAVGVAPYKWFEADITTTGGRGVTALGFCAAFRNDQIVPAGQARFTLSNGSTASITLPILGRDTGHTTTPQYIFLGYQAPAGLTIIRVEASLTSTPGGSYVSIDDMSFVTAYVAGPEAIADLAASGSTGTSIALTWTAPVGSPGAAGSYDIRYSTSPIDETNWASATQVTGEPTPADPGTSQNMTVSDLNPDTTYYFAMKTSDDVPETSALSNVATGATQDVVAPASVTDLTTGSLTGKRITLTWTAPGDNDSAGTATSYDIRYSTSAIDETSWDSAIQVTGEPTPVAAGKKQSMAIWGLSPTTTYYFAMKTMDEVSNASALSNVVSETTVQVVVPPNKPLLGPRDFKYKGCYRVPNGGSFSELNYGQGFTHRYVNGQLRFLTFSFYGNVPGGGHQLIEFAPASSLGGACTFTNHWPDIFAGTGLTNGGGSWKGLWFEQAKNRLWTTWAIDYTGTDYTKSLAVRTLNDDGTISDVAGPWGLAGVNQRRLYGGAQAIPQWFQDAYNVGPYGTGWGGYASMLSTGPVSLGPTFFALPEPTGYSAGDIPTSAFKALMDHRSGSVAYDWYAGGFPTSYDRGVRNCDVINEYDGGRWLSPAPDGLGRWAWGDSNWNTGAWIETPNKQGFITVPHLGSGRVWYTMELNSTRHSAEIQVFDPAMLGQVAQGARAVWNTYPTYRWQITDDMRPLGLMAPGNGGIPAKGPAGATYDSTTQTLYVYCLWGTNLDSYILVYDVDKEPAAVDDVAIAETAVAGTVSGTRANTETNDNVRESIQEVVPAGGDTSQLQHKWIFTVTAGSGVEFQIKAHRSDNTDGDDFVFAYSTNGTDWTNMLTVSRTTDDGTFQTYTLPGGTQGTVYVRVQDSDRTSGNTSLDTIYIDKMYFHSLPGTHLPGDINNDGYVNVGDLQLLVAAWGTAISNPSTWNPSADVNIDGYVNVGDLQLLVAHWGQSLP